jgi:hypothetical protein
MRGLTQDEIKVISGAIGPPGAIAGAAGGVVAYVGTQAGAGQTATWSGAGQAAVGGAVLGFFTPATTAQAVGAGIAGFYGGFAGGLVSRGTDAGS